MDLSPFWWVGGIACGISLSIFTHTPKNFHDHFSMLFRSKLPLFIHTSRIPCLSEICPALCFSSVDMKKVVLNQISFYFAFSYEYQSLLTQVFPCEFGKVFQGHIRIIASAHFLLGISYLRIKYIAFSHDFVGVTTMSCYRFFDREGYCHGLLNI